MWDVMTLKFIAVALVAATTVLPGLATSVEAQKTSTPEPQAKAQASAQPKTEALKAPALVSAQEVSQGLHPDRTDVQRNAFWPSVSGKDVRWSIKVDEVTTGWFSGFKVRGKVTSTMQVSCELEDAPDTKAIIAKINKGDRVFCTGKLKGTFVVLFGLTTVSIAGSAISRN
jgi:hypothetical protein